MTEELKETGLNVGRHRVGRLMRQNSISFVRYRRYSPDKESATLARSSGTPDGAVGGIVEDGDDRVRF